MSCEPPPAKRQRNEDEPITRSEMWNSDGSVILQAENTQFRVHWSVLARHSSIFSDMQELPQPADQSNVDGCPVVELSDDPKDVEYLLKALYIPQKTLPLSAVGAIIRLGRKYDFKDLFDSAVARLMSKCPSTLEAYVLYDPLRTTDNAFELYDALEFDIVALASENKILSALPCVYFHLINNFELSYLFDEIRRPDGTVARLPSLDLQRCVVAREKLLAKQFQEGYTLGWARKWPFDDCAKSRCRTKRESIMNWYLEDSELAALEPPTRIGGGFDQLCTVCTKHATESTVAGRKKVWEELPSFFDLPPWTELKSGM
ncbi:hypothetical protein DFH08DRAFT_975661 [Mycena albidolilacea]|uniref:BTB domain-containing protein n=1 Tax=Mycena albidolilacea TaxID=1033008 RepID=A0AAD6Z4C7_9AGAR|nr:hypothetical protein DFH08DRAFT_975661 [Mycena albidolilacea]